MFEGLPAAVVGVSPYSLGAFGANHALRQNFVYLDLAVMQQPEAYIGDARNLMDGRGRITHRKTDAFLSAFMTAFDAWIARARHAPERFEDFLVRREKVSLDYINGRADSLLEMSALQDPATFFPPSGKLVHGARAVNTANRSGAKAFAVGSKGRFEVLQAWSSGELGFWSGVQHAKVMMRGKDRPVAMQLRVTEVFRVDQGRWKLVHRHADMAQS